MVLYVVGAFRKAGHAWRKRDGFVQRDRLDRMGSLGVFVPLILDDLTDRFIEQQQHFTEQVEAEAQGQSTKGEDDSEKRKVPCTKLGLSSPPSRALDVAIPSSSPPSLLEVQPPLAATSPTLRGPVNRTWAAPTKGGRPTTVDSPASLRRSSLSQSSGMPLRPTRPRGSIHESQDLGRRPSDSDLVTRSSWRASSATVSVRRGSDADRSSQVNAARANRRISSSEFQNRGALAGRVNSAPHAARRQLPVGRDRNLGNQSGLTGRFSRFLNPSRGLEEALVRSSPQAPLKAEALALLSRPGLISQRGTRAKLISAGVSVANGSPHQSVSLGTLEFESQEAVPNAFAPDRQVRSDEDLEKAKQMMTSYVNRANSRWTGNLKWDSPQLFSVDQFERLGALSRIFFPKNMERKRCRLNTKR
jgi:hypothetical protein